ncbi:Vif protein [SIV-wrc Pbt-05GM-X02]|uniref:Virion infectivity factor n=1 Tax=SIV-wrc Pbt-05GM-X02 TaxID=498715 RepID=B3CKG9_SIV|nr:Vif protein [SIV-wrc Pbt-05GM-X02]
MEKEWIAVPLIKISKGRFRRWSYWIAELIQEKQARFLFGSWHVHAECFTRHIVRIPLQGHWEMQIRCYWNLAPEIGWIDTLGFNIRMVWENKWETFITVKLADVLIHSQHFECWTQSAVKNTIRQGYLHPIDSCKYHQGHLGVLTLQALCLQALQHEQLRKRKAPNRRTPGNTRGSSRYARAVCHGKTAFPPGSPCKSISLLLATEKL